jgi:hypothetical protein
VAKIEVPYHVVSILLFGQTTTTVGGLYHPLWESTNSACENMHCFSTKKEACTLHGLTGVKKRIAEQDYHTLDASGSCP